MKKISIYVVNKKLKPANYYRIVQYAKYIPGAKVYNITPTVLFDLAVRFRKEGKETLKGKEATCSKKNNKWRKALNEIIHQVSMKRLARFLKKDLKRKPDYVVVQKSMGKRHVPKEIVKMRKKLVENTNLIWDFDDNILQGNEILQDEFDLYCKNAKHIFVTSEYLRDTLPEDAKQRVTFLPTTDMQMPIKEEQLEEISQKRIRKMQKEINLIWVATSGNRKHLEPILDVLDETAKEIQEKYNKKTVLTIVCDKKIKNKYQYLKINNIKWTRKKAIKEVKKASIGIMPLTDSEYARGKGGFKLIQYISTGLPVVASNVGYNNIIFKDDIGALLEDKESKNPWKEEILKLVESEEKWKSCSKKAYHVWKKYYNYEDNLKLWQKTLS